jgi:uncharacterized protein YjbJ (UPF0337 family)
MGCSPDLVYRLWNKQSGNHASIESRGGGTFSQDDHLRIQSNQGETDMDATQDIILGKWHELKGQVRQQWGKLTDDDVAQLSGKTEELVGVLQQRYGYGKAQAEIKIKQWLIDHDAANVKS